MNALVVYFSKFGNTKKVAETIARVLGDKASTQLIPFDQLTIEALAGADLVVMGCPTHRMNLPEVVRPMFEWMPKHILKGKLFAAFDTSYKMKAWLQAFTAAKKLNQKLRKLGGKRLLRSETFLVMEREGPLYDGEIERAEAWARTILQNCPM